MELAVPILPVDDLVAAKRFYVEQLGFELEWEWKGGENVGLMGVRRGTIQITLDCPMSGHGRDACVSLRVDDADRYYEEWAARVAIKRAPHNEDWGSRTFGLTDPFGNTIFVIGPVT